MKNVSYEDFFWTVFGSWIHSNTVQMFRDSHYSNSFSICFTLNAQPSTGCASSMYKTRKSTCPWKRRTILLNCCRSTMNSGQEHDPKFITNGRPGCWKSNKLHRRGISPSRQSTGTSIAGPWRNAFLTRSLQRICKRVFRISVLNIVCQNSSGCTRHLVHFRKRFCSIFWHTGIILKTFPTTNASQRRLAKKYSLQVGRLIRMENMASC